MAAALAGRDVLGCWGKDSVRVQYGPLLRLLIVGTNRRALPLTASLISATAAATVAST